MLHAGEPFRFALTQAAARPKSPCPTERRNGPASGDAGNCFWRHGPARHLPFARRHERVAFCVNVLDAAESNTKPREELQLGKFNTIGATATLRANMEVWRWIGAAALAVLMFEWWFYHRRTA